MTTASTLHILGAPGAARRQEIEAGGPRHRRPRVTSMSPCAAAPRIASVTHGSTHRRVGMAPDPLPNGIRRRRRSWTPSRAVNRSPRQPRLMRSVYTDARGPSEIVGRRDLDIPRSPSTRRARHGSLARRAPSIVASPPRRPRDRPGSCRARRSPNKWSRATVRATMRRSSSPPAADSFTVSRTRSAAMAAPLSLAASITRENSAEVASGRAASCTTIRSASAETRSKAFATESWRRAPPVTICSGFRASRRNAGGADAISGGSDSTTSRTNSCASSVSNERKDGAPAERRHLLGTPGPNRHVQRRNDRGRARRRVWRWIWLDGLRSACVARARAGRAPWHRRDDLLHRRQRPDLHRRRVQRAPEWDVDDGDIAGTGHHRPAATAAAHDRQRHDRQTGFERQQKAAGAEVRHAAAFAPRAFRKYDQRKAIGDETPPLLEDARPIRIASIDEQMPGPLEVPSKKGISAKRRLGDDSELERKRREQNRDVVDALMIRHEHVGLARRDALEPSHRHPNAGRHQNQRRPGARAAVREVALAIDERGQQREGAKDDRVDRNRRNEHEHRPPPTNGGERRAAARPQFTPSSHPLSGGQLRARGARSAKPAALARTRRPRQCRAPASETTSPNTAAFTPTWVPDARRSRPPRQVRGGSSTLMPPARFTYNVVSQEVEAGASRAPRAAESCC